MKLRERVNLKKQTTLRISGVAKYFVKVKTENDLLEALKFADEKNLKWDLIGEGSNLVVSDRVYDGLIIENAIEKFDRKTNSVRVGSGNNLFKLITKLDRLGLAGLEKMAGIPGSIGGAVYGSAGAYGQEIKDRVTRVRYLDKKNRKFKWLSKKDCKFSYRFSIFKKNKDWIITEVELNLSKGRGLTKISNDIVKLRLKKYKKGLKCPGSFFQNIKLDEMTKKDQQKLLSKVDSDKIVYGKLPVGYLLEEVGAKGLKQGSIRVATHHANLIYNTGGGRASDIKKLSKKLKKKVKKKFGIMIEEEVQYL